MKQIGVECRFLEDGSLLIRSIQVDGYWQTVEQGRGWIDGDGRHVLVLLPDGQAGETLLRSDTLTWQLALHENRNAAFI